MPSNFSIYKQNGRQNFPSAAKEVKVEITFKDEQGTDLFGLNNKKTFGTVEGYLSKEFEYTSTGNYVNIFDDKFGDSLLYKVIEDESQRNIMNHGYLTKKMYKNGDSPTIDISFRCYGGDYLENPANYNKINHPIAVANALINATLPRVGEDAVMNFTDLSHTKIGEVATNILKTSVAGVKNIGSLISFPGSKTLDEANKESNAAVDEATISIIKNGSSMWDYVKSLQVSDLVSKKPPVCLLKIGNIFEKDMMVVKTVSVKISKEFISEGLPLYVDIDVSFQSLFNSATLQSKSGSTSNNEKIFGSGLNIKGTTSRVSFDA